MTSNEQVILERVLQQSRSDVAPELTESDYFAFFSIERILKHANLSWDEIEYGITDGPNDGGIDAFFLFVNGILTTSDSQLPALQNNATVELDVFQAKKERSFSEGPLDKLLSSLPDLLTLENDLDGLHSTYNEAVRSSAESFRRVFLSLAPNFPRLVIHVHYVSQGTDVHPNVGRKGEKVTQAIRDHFPDADVQVHFIGAASLLELAQSSTPTTYRLPVAETVSTQNEGFVCLVALSDFNQLITADDGTLRTDVFEANVRDYQGNVEVNSEIRNTLEDPKGEDFWWLNNGVTILASRGALAGKTLTIDSPQIVNGLQTSSEIQKYFSRQGDIAEPRHLLVRVIMPTSEGSRDRIIRATNSQTSIPPASLRATDPLQGQIETFFKTHGLYYERRKNHYKNQGRPREQLVSIPYLAQAVISVALAEPDNARARPSSLLKDDQDYRRVFNPNYPVGLYLVCARLMRNVDQYLLRKTDYPANQRNNVKFHMGYCVARRVAERMSLSPGDVADIVVEDVTDEHLAWGLGTVEDVFGGILEEGAFTSQDRVAKSRRGLELLSQTLETLL